MSSKKSNWAVCWVEFVCAFPRRICIDFFIAERNLSHSPKPMRGTKPGQLHSECILCPSKISLNKANPLTQCKPSVWYLQTPQRCATSFQNKSHKIRHKGKINSNKSKKKIKWYACNKQHFQGTSRLDYGENQNTASCTPYFTSQKKQLSMWLSISVCSLALPTFVHVSYLTRLLALIWQSWGFYVHVQRLKRGNLSPWLTQSFYDVYLDSGVNYEQLLRTTGG